MFCPVYKAQMLALRSGGVWILIQKITWSTNNRMIFLMEILYKIRPFER